MSNCCLQAKFYSGLKTKQKVSRSFSLEPIHLLVWSTAIEKTQNPQTNPGSGDIIRLVWLADANLDREYLCETLRYSFSLPLLGSLPLSLWIQWDLLFLFPGKEYLAPIVFWKGMMKSGVKCTDRHGRQEKRLEQAGSCDQRALLGSGVDQVHCRPTLSASKERCVCVCGGGDKDGAPSALLYHAAHSDTTECGDKHAACCSLHRLGKFSCYQCRTQSVKLFPLGCWQGSSRKSGVGMPQSSYPKGTLNTDCANSSSRTPPGTGCSSHKDKE